MHTLRTIAGSLLVLAISGCDLLSPHEKCELIEKWTITVEIVDAATGDPAPVGATVIVRGVAFYDSVVVAQPISFSPRMGYITSESKTKPGRYSVEVRKPGYINWIQNDVDVESHGCHSSAPLTTALLLRRP